MKNKFFLILLFACIQSGNAHAQPIKAAPFSWTNLPRVTEPVFKKDTFNIIRYGAVADGLTLNTSNINDAITACSQKGGGVVLVPGGLWLTGPVQMKSNVNLHIVREAILLFTKDLDQYPLVEACMKEGGPQEINPPSTGTTW
jgi:polygalacturonase